MNSIGIHRDDGSVYEGSHTSGGFRVNPAPLLLPIRFESDVIDLPADNYRGLAVEIFREDSFDPVTRIRRGRVYTRRNQTQPWEWWVQDPYRLDLKSERFGSGAVKQQVALTTYHRDPLTRLRGNAGKHPRVILGSEPFFSYWKLLSIENSSVDVPVLTLKALLTIADLPELKAKRLPARTATLLEAAWGQLNDSINTSGPSAVVDRCRDVLSIAVGHLVRKPSNDLGLSIKDLVSKNDGKEDLVSWSSRIVARLHSRGKPNEQHARSLRPLSHEDAQLAIHCVAVVITEIGWSK